MPQWSCEHCFTHRKDLETIGEGIYKRKKNKDGEWIFDARIGNRVNGQKNLNYRNLETTVHWAPCDTVRMLALSLGHANVRKGHTCIEIGSFTASTDKQMLVCTLNTSKPLPGLTIYYGPIASC